MIPAAGTAHLHDVHREFLAGLGQPDQLLGRAGRTRDRSQPLAVDPRYEGELLLPADRACDLTPTPMKFGRPQQIRIRVAHLRDIHPSRVHVGQQRPAPKRVVHYLPLNSHENQSSGRL